MWIVYTGFSVDVISQDAFIQVDHCMIRDSTVQATLTAAGSSITQYSLGGTR